MLLPIEWLRDFVDCGLSEEALADRLTMAGSEVEGIQNGVLNVKITPNRGDCLSVWGMAREAAAILGTPLKPAALAVEESGPDAASLTSVEILDENLCPRYSCRVMLGVEVGPSPDWMQQRLVAANVRPINNVVDCTNYVMLEMGQPLHAFDFNLLQGKRIVVRRARAGERLITIDGVDREMSPDMLMIADAARPVAVAGVMGGLETEVSEKTVNVLLESAHFWMQSVRRTAKALGMSTGASFRFERFVDPELTVRALDRVARLIRETAGGQVASGIVDAYPKPAEIRTLSLRPDRCNMILGFSLSPEEMKAILTRDGLACEGSDPIQATIPIYRFDLQEEIDLVEEVGRLHGYDHILTDLSLQRVFVGKDDPSFRQQDRARESLLASGLTETVTHSLIAPEEAAWVGGETLRLRNPLSDDLSTLRNSLMPSLLRVTAYNASRGNHDAAFFEIGKIYLPANTDTGGQEQVMVAGAMAGTFWKEAWNVSKEQLTADFFILKGAVEQLVRDFRVGPSEFQAADHPLFEPGRAAAILLDGQRCGVIGELSAVRQDALNLNRKTYLFEMDADALIRASEAVSLRASYRAPSRYPTVERDISFLIDADLQAAPLESAIREAGGALVESVFLFDLYQGDRLPEGKKSLAYSIVFRAPDRTLTETEVAATMAAVRARLRGRFGASIRE
ncbi:MAG: phenylalanine--tRNA ligase subunit beta [Armatimonadetes bacterium]|nr:phenylalanine--tRNA ligase subunit beta [Armatimonadota bacterium]